MRTLYMVSSGCYSDYSVMCVCETEEHARKLVAAHNGGDRYDDAFIEAVELFTDTDEPVNETTHRASVELWDDGTAGDIKQWHYSYWNFQGQEHPPHRPEVRFVRAPCHKGKGGRLEIWGNEFNSVAKTASERRAAFLAGAWRPKEGDQD